jgi:2-dehydropantoate 2-reductase
MGAFIGSAIAKGGEEVWFLDPYEAHMRAINENGLKVKVNGVDSVVQGIRATTKAEDVGKVDVAILMVKGVFTKQACENLRTISGDDTVILTLQNGVGNIDIMIEEGFHVSRLGHGVVAYGASMIEPGYISGSMKNDQHVHIGPYDKSYNSVLDKTAQVMAKGGFQAHYMDDPEIHIWEKLGRNCGGNAPSGLARTNLGGWLCNPIAKPLTLLIQDEVVKVAHAKGIMLDREIFVKANQVTDIGPMGAHLTSTAQDLLAKKPTEIEFLNGAVVREGKKLGIETPYNNAIYILTKVYENDYDSKLK